MFVAHKIPEAPRLSFQTDLNAIFQFINGHFCDERGLTKEASIVKTCFFLQHMPLDVTAPGVKFTNILCAAFTRKDPKSKKKTVQSSSFLRLWDLRV